MNLYWFIETIFHFDKHLQTFIQNYGNLSYGLLFLIIFIETGLVLMPFLPGDSLLFVAGAFAANGSFSFGILFVVCTVAAILGDTVNYSIGFHGGNKILARFIKKEHLQKTEDFYNQHGKKTIILARFVPIVRTFAPFVAGVGKMHYATFIRYNIIGGVAWVAIFLVLGYFFGSIQFIKDNLTKFVLGIILISLLPGVWHYVKNRKTSGSQSSESKH